MRVPPTQLQYSIYDTLTSLDSPPAPTLYSSSHSHHLPSHPHHRQRRRQRQTQTFIDENGASRMMHWLQPSSEESEGSEDEFLSHTNETEEYKTQELDNHTFWRNQWLDAFERHTETWQEAQVIQLEFDELQRIHRILIRYRSGNERESEEPEEWLDLSNERERGRIAQLHTFTTPPRTLVTQNMEERKFHEGDQIDVKHSAEGWMQATVIEVDTFRDQIRVRYDGNVDSYPTEWLNADSYRIAPLHTNTHPVIRDVTHRYLNSRARKPPLPTNSFQRTLDGERNVSTWSSPATTSSPFTATQRNERLFREVLRTRLGFVIVDQEQDGNCLFRSVSHQVYADPSYHFLVRDKCMTYIQSEKNFFKDYIAEDFEQYINRMRNDGEWGDHVEIQAMSEIYDRTIEIYAYSLTPFKVFNSASCASQTQLPIRLSYHFASHYNSIVDRMHLVHAANRNDPPGIVEDRAIQRSLLRSEHASRTSPQPALVTEAQQLQQALDASRQQFSVSDNADDVEHAVHESLNLLNTQHDGALEAAKSESLREYDDQQQLQQAIQASAEERSATVRNSNSSSSNNLEEQQLRRAMEESMRDSEVKEIAHLSPVQRCMELGFSEAQSLEAYSILANTGLSDDEMVANMTELLFHQQQ